MSSSDDKETDNECPLCMEPYDIQDKNFLPCDCGYKICGFCWHRIKNESTGLCPACRQPFKDRPAKFTPISHEIVIKMKNEKRKKIIDKKTKENECRKILANIRVIQKNLIYVIGLSIKTADEEELKKSIHFSEHGKIIKIVLNKGSLYNGNQNVSAYITYSKKSEAASAIHAVDGSVLDGRVLRASFGTTKYCSYFLRHIPCPNPECMYLHELGEEQINYLKDELPQGKIYYISSYANISPNDPRHPHYHHQYYYMLHGDKPYKYKTILNEFNNLGTPKNNKNSFDKEYSLKSTSKNDEKEQFLEDDQSNFRNKTKWGSESTTENVSDCYQTYSFQQCESTNALQLVGKSNQSDDDNATQTKNIVWPSVPTPESVSEKETKPWNISIPKTSNHTSNYHPLNSRNKTKTTSKISSPTTKLCPTLLLTKANDTMKWKGKQKSMVLLQNPSGRTIFSPAPINVKTNNIKEENQDSSTEEKKSEIWPEHMTYFSVDRTNLTIPVDSNPTNQSIDKWEKSPTHLSPPKGEYLSSTTGSQDPSMYSPQSQNRQLPNKYNSVYFNSPNLSNIKRKNENSEPLTEPSSCFLNLNNKDQSCRLNVHNVLSSEPDTLRKNINNHQIMFNKQINNRIKNNTLNTQFGNSFNCYDYTKDKNSSSTSNIEDLLANEFSQFSFSSTAPTSRSVLPPGLSSAIYTSPFTETYLQSSKNTSINQNISQLDGDNNIFELINSYCSLNNKSNIKCEPEYKNIHVSSSPKQYPIKSKYIFAQSSKFDRWETGSSPIAKKNVSNQNLIQENDSNYYLKKTNIGLYSEDVQSSSETSLHLLKNRNETNSQETINNYHLGNNQENRNREIWRKSNYSGETLMNFNDVSSSYNQQDPKYELSSYFNSQSRLRHDKNPNTQCSYAQHLCTMQHPQ